MSEREELLKELSTLIHPSGRKRRTDKGKKHEYPESRSAPSKSREDKGTVRGAYGPQLPTQIYDRMKQKFASHQLEVDDNGYYIVIPAEYKTVATDYKQKYKGREIQHTTKRVCVQNELDLEKYRFEAWQFMSMNQPNEPATCIPEIRAMLLTRYGVTLEEANKAIEQRQITWFDLFCEFYHIGPETRTLWDYDSWRTMYNYCPRELLPDDFVFSLTYRPGSPEFYPEWAYHADELIKQEQESIEAEKERRKLQFANHWRRK